MEELEEVRLHAFNLNLKMMCPQNAYCTGLRDNSPLLDAKLDSL